MQKTDIKQLRVQEEKILLQRERLKQEIRELTKDLYNTRQKISYECGRPQRKKAGLLYEMFGKEKPELTAEELKFYNKTMQKKRRENR